MGAVLLPFSALDRQHLVGDIGAQGAKNDARPVSEHEWPPQASREPWHADTLQPFVVIRAETFLQRGSGGSSPRWMPSIAAASATPVPGRDSPSGRAI